MDRKGFIHVVEIVVISLVVFILVFQFTTIPAIRADWDRTKLALQGNDILFTLDRAGVSWLNSQDMGQALSPLLEGTNINYRVSVENAIKSDISVACICTPQERSELASLLEPFTLNDEAVSFEVILYDPDVTTGRENPARAFTLEHDLVYFGEYFLTQTAFYDLDDYLDQMSTYLRNGKGLVLEQDLTGSLFQSGRQGQSLTQLFGVEAGQGLAGTQDILFETNALSEFYNIEKYFRHIPSGIDWGDGQVRLANFLDSGETVQPTGADTERVVLKGAGAAGSPALIVNSRAVAGQGRTAWLSAGMEDQEARKNILRALFAWAAGDTYDVVPGTVPEPVSFSLYKTIRGDMVQPVRIVLSLGYIF